MCLKSPTVGWGSLSECDFLDFESCAILYMQEKDFTTLVCKSVTTRGGFAHKMPDPPFSEIMRGAPRRPYDLFYVLLGKSVHLEAKFLKGYDRFALDRVEDHQYDNLMRVKDNAALAPAGVILSVVAVAVWEPRKIYDVFFFDISLLSSLRMKTKSLSKKTMLGLKALGSCLTIQHSDIDIDRVSEVLIWSEDQLPRS